MDHQNGNFTLFVTSNANLDMYPDNKASKFTNVLKQPIKLDPNVEFQARLANFHIPNAECIFKKNDFKSSNLKYNVGLFEYDTKSNRYLENKSYRREIFNLAPNKNIEGLFEGSSHKSIFNPSNPVNNSEMDPFGKPYSRIQKEKFMDSLNHSLKLSKDKTDKYYKELKILNLFKQCLNKAKKYNFGNSDNLMINQFLDLNYIQMAEFSHLKEHSKLKFFYKLLSLVDYTNSSREFLLNATGLANPKTNLVVKDRHTNVSPNVEFTSNIFDMNSTRKRTRPKSPNSLNEDKSPKKVARNKTPAGGSHHGKAISLANFSNDEIRMLHRNFYVTSDISIPKIINKRDTSSLFNISPKGIKNLAHRWGKFAEDYKKTWKRAKVSFDDKEEGGEKEEEEEKKKKKKRKNC